MLNFNEAHYMQMSDEIFDRQPKFEEIGESLRDRPIENIPFHSRVVADKLRGIPRVFLSVVTAGEELDECDDLEDDPFLDIFKGALLHHGMMYVTQMMQERFGFDGSSRLNPGSLPDWPIGNNFAVFDMIGGLDEIGVTLNAAGYIHPWNSASQIHFPGNGYENCSLCKKYDCIRRRAPFDRAEYRRVFGINPWLYVKSAAIIAGIKLIIYHAEL